MPVGYVYQVGYNVAVRIWAADPGSEKALNGKIKYFHPTKLPKSPENVLSVKFCFDTRSSYIISQFYRVLSINEPVTKIGFRCLQDDGVIVLI